MIQGGALMVRAAEHDGKTRAAENFVPSRARALNRRPPARNTVMQAAVCMQIE
jgi:hypothetical protein